MIERIRDEYGGSDMGLREVSEDSSYRMGVEEGYRKGYADAMREASHGGSYRERMPRDSYGGGYRMPGNRIDPDEMDYDDWENERRRRDSRGRYM